MMGANAPTTITGTMVQANAAAIAGAVLIHYLCPGTPTWYYFFIQAMDKRTGGNIFMNPEIVLCSLADEAQDKVGHLLEQHEVPPLEGSLQKELNRIEQSAIKSLLKS